MAVTVRHIIEDRVRRILRDIDTGGVLWLDAELLSWYNEALSVLLSDRPESSSLTETLPLAAGALQRIPAGGSRLLEVICNMSGLAEGRVVRRVDRSDLDNENLNWMEAAQSAVIFRYAPSLTDPRTFYVYPPSNGTSSEIRIVFAAPPEKLLHSSSAEIDASLDTAFQLPAEYEAMVANYILHRAFAKMAEKPEMEQRSISYLNMYKAGVQGQNMSMEQNNAVTRDA